MKKLLTKTILSTIFLSLIVNADTLPTPQMLKVDTTSEHTQALKKVAQTYAAFWNTGEEKYAKQALSKDFIDLNLPKGRKQGIQGPLDASKWFRSVVPDLKAQIKEMIIAGDTVVLRLKFTGHFTGKFHNTQGKGQKIDFDAVDIYTIKDGKIKTNWHLEDNQALLEQLNNPHVSQNFKLSSPRSALNSCILPFNPGNALAYWPRFPYSRATRMRSANSASLVVTSPPSPVARR